MVGAGTGAAAEAGSDGAECDRRMAVSRAAASTAGGDFRPPTDADPNGLERAVLDGSCAKVVSMLWNDVLEVIDGPLEPERDRRLTTLGAAASASPSPPLADPILRDREVEIISPVRRSARGRLPTRTKRPLSALKLPACPGPDGLVVAPRVEWLDALLDMLTDPGFTCKQDGRVTQQVAS